ncbi:pentapeptide repeat family protein [Streptomyces himastatinicus ATCC 53653]|uniref:Pentapeptide repeat family protein n=1 Tax=Streptomyces himastatinicus ATCC 53653 TaxID=457427 RepID=D9WB40_9ACTN|nr:pentapeptide repeat family protein [Streptomyces himastatinicus ATCC 53653]
MTAVVSSQTCWNIGASVRCSSLSPGEEPVLTRGRWSTQLRAAVTLIVVLVVAVGISFLLLQWVPHRLADAEAKQLKPSERLTHLNNVRGMVLQTAAGLAVLGGLIYTARGYVLSRQSQITDRYASAVSQLSSEYLDARLGGVFALQRLAGDSRHDVASITQVLSSFIVRRRPVTGSTQSWRMTSPERTGQLTQGPRPEADVQAALDVLGSMRRTTRAELAESDLRGAELQGLSFERGDMRRCLLRGSNLRQAILREAELDGTDLRGARLDGADLTGGRLSRTDLRGAEIKEATFTDCSLSSARLDDAWASSVSLRRADLFSARLDGARLDGADLRDATLINVSLVRVDLTGADLSGADVYGADFTGAVLVAADLRSVQSLTPEQLNSAVLGQLTRLPAEFTHLLDDRAMPDDPGTGIVII